MAVIYWRAVANVIDMRIFKDWEELKDWIVRQVKLEPTAIIGIFDKDTELREADKAYAKFVKKFRTGQICNIEED